MAFRVGNFLRPCGIWRGPLGNVNCGKKIEGRGDVSMPSIAALEWTGRASGRSTNLRDECVRQVRDGLCERRPVYLATCSAMDQLVRR